ncbi:MAG: hypothetical protein ACJ72L_18630 [Marmoricola sp.]
MDPLTETLVREVLGEELPPVTFRTVESKFGAVALESSELRCQISLSPRGEYEISVAPIGTPAWQGWTYSGFVGRADLRRLLELTRELLTSEPRILGNDGPFFAALAQDRQRDSDEYNARARGERVPPRADRLP